MCNFPDLFNPHLRTPPPHTHTIRIIKAQGKIPLEGHIFKSKTLMRMQSLLIKFFKHGLIKPCQSSFNTQDLPIHKPNEEYQFVQDLQALNAVVIPIHPVVSNPHTLLAQVPARGHSVLLFWTSKLHFSLSLYIHITLAFLSLKRTLTPWRLTNITGQ